MPYEHSLQTATSLEEPVDNRGPWRDLQTKGYVVIRSFLSDAEIDFLIGAFNTAQSFANASAYRMVSPKVIEEFRPKLAETVTAVAKSTDLRVDLLTGSVFFAISLGTDLGWHQDHESFYQFGDHYHYLNFYIPFKKPVREKSNLSVIPLDKLAKCSPRAYRQRLGKGACVASSLMGRTILKDHDRGGFSVLPCDFDEIGETPELGPGDLLLLRGDVFHKTQDTETDRISISFRMVNSKTIVKRSSLVSFGASLEKFLLHSKNRFRRSRYQDWSRVFDEARKRELPADEYLSILKRVESGSDKSSQGSWGQFLRTFQKNWISS